PPLASRLAAPRRCELAPEACPLPLPHRGPDEGAPPTGASPRAPPKLAGSPPVPDRRPPRPGRAVTHHAREEPLLFALVIIAGLPGCRNGRPAAPAAAPAQAGTASSPVRFTDVADRLGVRFKHTNGEAGQYFIAETMGAGCAFLDYDGDGRLDLFLV